LWLVVVEQVEVVALQPWDLMEIIHLLVALVLLQLHPLVAVAVVNMEHYKE
jgi:hypothetical protein